MEFVNNPWFIGIGGGILSGLVVTFISMALLSRRDKREHAQKVLGANREIVYAVRPGIAEGLVPNFEVLDALVNATARRYAVDRKDLHQPFEIAQELIKEVMDSSFISAKTKEEYCARLGALASPKAPTSDASFEADTEGTAPQRPGQVEEYRSRMVQMMSIMMGLLAASMTMLLSLSDGVIDLANEPKERLTKLLLPALITMAAGVLSVGVMSTMRDLRHRPEGRKRNTESKSPRNEENPRR